MWRTISVLDWEDPQKLRSSEKYAIEFVHSMKGAKERMLFIQQSKVDLFRKRMIASAQITSQ
jgi:hypothetical protein